MVCYMGMDYTIMFDCLLEYIIVAPEPKMIVMSFLERIVIATLLVLVMMVIPITLGLVKISGGKKEC